MKYSLLLIIILLLLSGNLNSQNALVDSLNLISDHSCEDLQALEANGRHPLNNVWAITAGNIRCFNSGALGTGSDPSDGDHFFADDVGNTTSTIEQIIDLGKDRTGDFFEFAYDYRLIGNTLKPDHTATMNIEFLSSNNSILGTLHSNINFAATNSYQTESDTSNAAPAGTQKIKWTLTWNDPPSAAFSDLIFDNFILRYTDNQCVGVPDFPYFCFSDPLLVSGDTIQMTCSNYLNQDSINALLNISESDKCDDDGKIKVVRRRSSAAKGDDQSTPKSLMACVQELIFEGDNFTTLACQDQLTLYVEVTDGNPSETLDFDVPPTATITCDYDLENDPDDLIGFPDNIVGNGVVVFSDDQVSFDCDQDAEIIRTWELVGCCNTIIKTQIINVLANTCSSINSLIINKMPVEDATYSAFTTINSTGSVAANSQVNFVAGQSITLEVGFVANSGSNFLARIASCEAQPPNDSCINATPINCGDFFVRNITNANFPTFVLSDPSCLPNGSTDTPEEGIFYKFEGTGDIVELNTVSNLTDFDTRLWLYEGTCGNFNSSCVDFNDNANGTSQSSINYQTTAGVSYFLYVDGHMGAKGNFALSMNCSMPTNFAENRGTDHSERMERKNDLTVSVFPNPFLEHITIKYTLSERSFTQIILRNLTGEIVQQIQPFQLQVKGDYQLNINLLDRPKGIYLVQILIEEKWGSEKIVKQ